MDEPINENARKHPKHDHIMRVMQASRDLAVALADGRVSQEAFDEAHKELRRFVPDSAEQLIASLEVKE